MHPCGRSRPSTLCYMTIIHVFFADFLCVWPLYATVCYDIHSPLAWKIYLDMLFTIWHHCHTLSLCLAVWLWCLKFVYVYDSYTQKWVFLYLLFVYLCLFALLFVCILRIYLLGYLVYIFGPRACWMARLSAIQIKIKYGIFTMYLYHIWYKVLLLLDMWLYMVIFDVLVYLCYCCVCLCV